jgi:hypothetical protein
VLSPAGLCRALLFHPAAAPPPGAAAPAAAAARFTADDACPEGGVFGKYMRLVPGHDPALF